MKRPAHCWPLCVFVAMASSSSLALAEDAPSAASADFFEKKIRPVLVKHCYECHSVDSEDVEGELLLDSRAGMHKGGETGPSVVPQNVDASLLIASLEYEDFEMPPEGKLPDPVIADFRQWIKSGAYDPRTDTPQPKEQKDGPVAVSPEELWSLGTLSAPKAPQVKQQQWPRDDIDRFILARFEQEQLAPVNDADALTLLRRLSFDLVGLPPTPAQIVEFQHDHSPTAIEALVDQMLASPQFGERWGRHWLDIARYGESNGKSRDVLMPHAWRYRDYVIDALNADMPFDRFVTEQLAGDLLEPNNDDEQTRLQIATGFLAIGSKPISGGNLQMDLADDQIDVIGKAFLGMTIGCARCHDHKFDPIPTADYYSLVGMFTSTETLYGGGLAGAKKNADQSKFLIALGNYNAKDRKAFDEFTKQLAKLTKPRAAFLRQIQITNKQLADEMKRPSPNKKKLASTTSRLKQLQTRLNETDTQIKQLRQHAPPAPQLAIGVRDKKKPTDLKVHIRGERKKLGQVAPRGFLTCVDVENATPVDTRQSGRLQLAQWITHPELLDHLATRFVDNAWSTKTLIRAIVLSRTYQLSSDFNAPNSQADPGNAFYWRMSRRRLEVEPLRDAMLAASGALTLERPHASPVAEIGPGEVGRNLNISPLNRPYPYRSVYLPIIRGMVPEILKAFDFPEPSNPQGQRDASNVPAQSLFLMNNTFVIEQARLMADRVLQNETEPTRRVELAFQLSFGRSADQSETDRALDFLKMTATSGLDKEQDGTREAWTTFCQALFSTSEFRFVN